MHIGLILRSYFNLLYLEVYAKYQHSEGSTEQETISSVNNEQQKVLCFMGIFITFPKNWTSDPPVIWTAPAFGLEAASDLIWHQLLFRVATSCYRHWALNQCKPHSCCAAVPQGSWSLLIWTVGAVLMSGSQKGRGTPEVWQAESQSQTCRSMGSFLHVLLSLARYQLLKWQTH